MKIYNRSIKHREIQSACLAGKPHSLERKQLAKAGKQNRAHPKSTKKKMAISADRRHALIKTGQMAIRNNRIYWDYRVGMKNWDIAQKYSLSTFSILDILKSFRQKHRDLKITPPKQTGTYADLFVVIDVVYDNICTVYDKKLCHEDFLHDVHSMLLPAMKYMFFCQLDVVAPQKMVKKFIAEKQRELPPEIQRIVTAYWPRAESGLLFNPNENWRKRC